jgi:hypothetical protein
VKLAVPHFERVDKSVPGGGRARVLPLQAADCEVQEWASQKPIEEQLLHYLSIY